MRSDFAAEHCYVGQTWRFFMRKKIRTISVEGKEYAWTIEGKLWPSFVLRVWRGKGDVWFEKEFAPPHSLGFVTPKDVADEIRSRLIRGAT